MLGATSKLALVLVAPGVFFLQACSVTPIPLTEEQLGAMTSINSHRVTEDQEPVHGAISLPEAIARALKYNLDYRIDTMQAALRAAEHERAIADELPKFVRNAGYQGRDNDYSTSSLDVPTGIVVDPNTVSSERGYNSADTTFSWNILDFALSYVRARQSSDKFLITQELRRKTIQRIIEDTRTAYWRAVASEHSSRKLSALQGRVQGALDGSASALKEGEQSPVTALSYERELVQIRQTAEQLEHELNLAKSQLAALMNLTPGTKFRLADANQMATPQGIDMPAKEMVAEAIFNRPEIREAAYEKRINEDEAIAAVFELLPGIREYSGDNFDGNEFLLNNNWLSWGTAAAGNLIKIAQLAEKSTIIGNQAAILEQKSLAVTMVVMTQVYVSRTKYKHLLSEFETSKNYVAVQQSLVDQLRAEAAAGSVAEQTLIREEMNLLVSEVERDLSYSELQNAAANLMVSMGLDLQGKDVDLKMDVPALTSHLKVSWTDRLALSDRGRYLWELEQARLEAVRKKEEVERKKREEEYRIAEEAKRVHDEEIARAKEEARIAKLDAERVQKEEADARADDKRRRDEDIALAKAAAEVARKEAARQVKEEAGHIKAEAQRAKFEAEQARKEEARQRKADADAVRDEARREKVEADHEREAARRLKVAEDRQTEREANLSRIEVHKARESEVNRLKAEANHARQDARKARREAQQGGSAVGTGAGASWLWPWEGPSTPAKKKAKRSSQSAQAD
jgi:outer membrane protein TolC